MNGHCRILPINSLESNTTAFFLHCKCLRQLIKLKYSLMSNGSSSKATTSDCSKNAVFANFGTKVGTGKNVKFWLMLITTYYLPK
jgi:hypothetical protein